MGKNGKLLNLNSDSPKYGNKSLVTKEQENELKRRKITFSFSYFKQIPNFQIGECSKGWHIGLLERLGALGTMTPQEVLEENRGSIALRCHPIDWSAKNIPIQRKDLDWLPKEILDNETDFPIMQFSITENKMTITYKQTDYTEPDRSYTEIYICEQNTDGYIEKETDPNNDYTTYSYKNGYLQNQQPSYSNQKYTYNWNNGNLVSYSAVGEWTTTITYSQSTATPINLDLNFVNEYRWSYHFWGLLGKKSKNLPQKSVLKHKDSANTLTNTYQYEFNSNKTISKVLVSEVQTGDYNESRNYSIKFVY